MSQQAAAYTAAQAANLEKLTSAYGLPASLKGRPLDDSMKSDELLTPEQLGPALKSAQHVEAVAAQAHADAKGERIRIQARIREQRQKLADISPRRARKEKEG